MRSQAARLAGRLYTPRQEADALVLPALLWQDRQQSRTWSAACDAVGAYGGGAGGAEQLAARGEEGTRAGEAAPEDDITHAAAAAAVRAASSGPASAALRSRALQAAGDACQILSLPQSHCFPTLCSLLHPVSHPHHLLGEATCQSPVSCR